MEKKTLGNKVSDAQKLVDTLAESLAEMEAETLFDTLIDAESLVDTLADFRKHWSTRSLTL